MSDPKPTMTCIIGAGMSTLWPWSAGHFHELLRRPEFDDLEFLRAT